MELKLFHVDFRTSPKVLLIVPYGIETGIRFYDIHQRALLIVPYGIETSRCQLLVCNLNTLLIVPYGIETSVLAR